MAERVSLYYGTELPDEIQNSRSGDIYYNTENKNIYIANPETSATPAKLVPTDIGMNYDTYRMLMRDLTTLGVANACVVDKSDLITGIDPNSLKEFLYLDDRFNNSTNIIMVLPAELEVIGDGIGSCFWKNRDTNSTISHIVFAPDEIHKLKRVAPCAFKGSQLTEITLPDGITEIGNNAFEGCSSLTSINLPNTVTDIGERAFYKCKSLYYIKIPCGVKFLLRYLFEESENLRYVVLPSTIEGIHENAFDKCYNLSEVYYEGSEEDWNKIMYSDKLTGVTTFFYSDSDPGTFGTHWHYNENGEIEIWNDFINYIFDEPWGEYNVDGINIPSHLSGDPLHIVVPSMYKNKSVTKISKEAFKEIDNLYSVVLPKRIYLGEGAFQNCNYLNSVKMPNTLIGDKLENCTFMDTDIEKITIPEDVTSIGDQAFYSCNMLTNITIPNSVTSIGDYVFCYCTGLASITIPESVTSIGVGSFQYCRSLTSIKVPEIVTSIGTAAFQYCTSLVSVTFGNNKQLNSISDYAFYGCINLTSIVIPDSVTSIGKYAFTGCSDLEIIMIPNSMQSIGISAFHGCVNLKTIYYYGTEQQYKSISIGIGNDKFKSAEVHYIQNV